MGYPKKAINDAFLLLPEKMDTQMARAIHAAIGYQETKYLTRVQYGGGPARSYWQFENGKLAAINGLLSHPATSNFAAAVCRQRGVRADRMDIWKAMEFDDVLGAAFARLLMYSDPAPLPTTREEAWEMYAMRTWRPGRPHPEAWHDSWAFGLERAK